MCPKTFFVGSAGLCWNVRHPDVERPSDPVRKFPRHVARRQTFHDLFRWRSLRSLPTTPLKNDYEKNDKWHKWRKSSLNFFCWKRAGLCWSVGRIPCVNFLATLLDGWLVQMTLPAVASNNLVEKWVWEKWHKWRKSSLNVFCWKRWSLLERPSDPVRKFPRHVARRQTFHDLFRWRSLRSLPTNL